MEFIITFIITALISFSLTPYVIKLAKKYQLVDDPDRRYHPAQIHKGIIPRAGGLAIFISVSLSIILFLGINKLTMGILISSLILTITGIIDDRNDVNPYLRLNINCLATLILIFSGIDIPYITNPISGGVIHLDNINLININIINNYHLLSLSKVFAFLWIMWTMNIVGWSAGVDGQMPGFVTIAAITLGILSFRFTVLDPNQMFVTILAFIIAGGFFGFLPWNFYPQKIMPGYGGKTLAGIYLAILAILAYAKVGTALLVLGVPVLDAIFTLLRRLTNKHRLVSADRGHLHHRLLEIGWGKRRIALFYWSISTILGLVALSVTSKGKVFIFLFTAVAFGGLLLWLKFFTQLSRHSDPDNG